MIIGLYDGSELNSDEISEETLFAFSSVFEKNPSIKLTSWPLINYANEQPCDTPTTNRNEDDCSTFSAQLHSELHWTSFTGNAM